MANDELTTRVAVIVCLFIVGVVLLTMIGGGV